MVARVDHACLQAGGDDASVVVQLRPRHVHASVLADEGRSVCLIGGALEASDQGDGRHGHKTCAREDRLRIMRAISAQASGGGPVSSASMSDRPDVPAHRYDGRVADEIETRWQATWDADGTYHAPNPSGPLADGFEAMQGKPKTFVLDMFPYPSGDGLHVGHPLGFIGTDVYARATSA